MICKVCHQEIRKIGFICGNDLRLKCPECGQIYKKVIK